MCGGVWWGKQVGYGSAGPRGEKVLCCKVAKHLCGGAVDGMVNRESGAWPRRRDATQTRRGRDVDATRTGRGRDATGRGRRATLRVREATQSDAKKRRPKRRRDDATRRNTVWWEEMYSHEYKTARGQLWCYGCHGAVKISERKRSCRSLNRRTLRDFLGVACAQPFGEDTTVRHPSYR